jgi:hypothetical protein
MKSPENIKQNHLKQTDNQKNPDLTPKVLQEKLENLILRGVIPDLPF